MAVQTLKHVGGLDELLISPVNYSIMTAGAPVVCSAGLVIHAHGRANGAAFSHVVTALTALIMNGNCITAVQGAYAEAHTSDDRPTESKPTAYIGSSMTGDTGDRLVNALRMQLH